MFIIANLLAAVAQVLSILLIFYMWVVIAAVVISWVSPDPYNFIVRFLTGATEPVFYQVRRRLPVSFGGLDLSPIVVIAAIYFLRFFLVKSLYDIAQRLSF
jgi:YggT family protein